MSTSITRRAFAGIFGKPKARCPSPDLIKDLEQLTELAKQGKIIGLYGVYVHRDRNENGIFRHDAPFDRTTFVDAATIMLQLAEHSQFG
jgi:hypothetical protein